MKLGIIGKPQSGKTSVFNAAAGQQAAVGDFSQAVHRAIVKVPDERLRELALIAQPKKVTHAEIEFLDAAGFTGKGKESGTLEVSADLRQMEAFMLVVDAFSAGAKPRVDIRNLIDEMILIDHALAEGIVDKRQRKMKLTGDKTDQRKIELLTRCIELLDEEKPLIELDLTDDDDKIIRGYQFLTRKPLLILLNIAESDIERTDEIVAQYSDFVDPGRREVTALCGKLESELAGLSEEERQAFLEDLGISVPAVELVIKESYKLLGLISFLTLGAPEVRAWTIPANTKAVKAAAAIHTDIERGFIRAEVVRYEDYVQYRTTPALKAAGKISLEGKDYLVQDGDVILFRFNV